MYMVFFFFSSRRRHTRCALVTGVQTCALPISIIAGVFFWSLRRGGERLPFLMALAIFFLGFVGLGVSLYPYIVPRAVTIWQAAAPAQSQVFMLVGVIIILPMILAYTGRSEEHTSELQSLMRISYAVFCLQKKTTSTTKVTTDDIITI